MIFLFNIFIIPFKIFKRISLSTIIFKSSFGKSIYLKGRTRFYNSSIGNHSFVGRYSFISSTNIGKYCSISDFVAIGLYNHDYSRLSSSTILHKKTSELHFKKTVIGNDVWIGYGAKIIAGVNIGDGAVVGAGSIVTKDVPPFAIVAGNPAKIIKFRFDNNKIKMIQKTEWWNKTQKEIENLDNEFFGDCGK